jgi:mono/diheme cytochrome c family protein
VKKLAVLCLCALAAVLALVEPSEADCRRVVVQKVAPAKKVVVVEEHTHHDVFASAFLLVPTPPYPIYGVGYGQDPAVAGELRALREEVRRLQLQVAPAAPASPATPPAASPRTAPPATMPPAAAASPAAFPEAGKLLAVVQAQCSRCHGTAKKDAGLSLVSADGSALAPLSRLDRLRAFHSVSRGKMPKGGSPVNDEALGLFALWCESE